MDPLTWTGSLSFLNPIFLTAAVLLIVAVIAQIVLSFFAEEAGITANAAISKPNCSCETAETVINNVKAIVVVMRGETLNCGREDLLNIFLPDKRNNSACRKIFTNPPI